MLAFTYPNRARRELPDSWHDIGPGAWTLLRALARRPGGVGKRAALRDLLGLSAAQFDQLDADDLAGLLVGLPWLGVTPITRPIRQSFRLGWRRYYLPEEDFLDGQAMAYALADGYFTESADAKDPAEAETAVLRLLATLARPRKGFGRAPLLNVEEVERRAERFRKLPPEHAVHALMLWAGYRERIAAMYGHWLFEPSPWDKQNDTEPGPHFGWWSVFQDVAGGGVFGNLAAVERANFHEVCQWLVRKEDVRRKNQAADEKQRIKAMNR